MTLQIWTGCFFDREEKIGYLFDEYGRQGVTTRAKSGSQIKHADGRPVLVVDETATSRRRLISIRWDILDRFADGLARETGAQAFATMADFVVARDVAASERARYLAAAEDI